MTLSGLRRSRRDCLRLLTLGGVVLAAGCSLPVSLPVSPDGLPELTLDTLSSLASGPSPTVAATASASPAASPGSLSTPGSDTPTPGPERLVVGKTGGDGVYIRSSIKPEKKVKVWPDGTSMVLVGADQTVDGHTWRHVRDPAGTVGWVPAQYLVQVLKVVTTPSAGATAGASSPTPGESVGAAPARWNVAELDAFANGNIPLAAAQLRALGVKEIKGRAQQPKAAVVLDDLPRYYGTVVRLEGYVGQVQAAPADSSIAGVLGLGVIQLVVSCRDGTVADLFQLGTNGEARIGDLVATYGLPAGQVQVEDHLAGSQARLVVVTKLIEKLAK